MALALPGARHLFSHMQLALAKKLGARVSLRKGVHQALEDFRWMLDNISSRPTRIAELVPLLSSAEGHHDVSGKAPRQDGFNSAAHAFVEPRVDLIV